MMPLKPSLFIKPSTGYVQAASLKGSPNSFPHISLFRSLLLDMRVFSPSLKVVEDAGKESVRSYPVFSEQDKIEGKVILDPSCSQTGRLTISLEGAFEYTSVKDNAEDVYPCKPTVIRHRHVFLSSSATTVLSSDSRSARVREALSVRKRPSTSSLNGFAYRSCDFSFELPRGSRIGEEMPPTFSYKTPAGGSGQLLTEELEVTYGITATWEASDGSDRAILEVPLLFQPDTDFQSLDGSAMVPKSWSEMPLIPERPVPFNCVVTIPRCQSFSRCSSIPYFVTFSTNNRSLRLVKEIAADATIAVSLIRTITITPQHTPPSPVRPDTPSSDESDGSGPSFAYRSRLLRLSARTSARSHILGEPFSMRKPLPGLPQEVFSTTRTLQTQVSIGFPKRPTNVSPNLPEGLHKDKVRLPKSMLPSVDWPGISVQYLLDVSVLVGQDDVRVRIPIWVY